MLIEPIEVYLLPRSFADLPEGLFPGTSNLLQKARNLDCSRHEDRKLIGADQFGIRRQCGCF
jgi:hypothetical protein